MPWNGGACGASQLGHCRGCCEAVGSIKQIAVLGVLLAGLYLLWENLRELTG